MAGEAFHKVPSWETLGNELVFQDLPWIRVRRDRVRTHAGRVVENFYAVELPAHALVVPILPDGTVLVTRQYKHAVGGVALGFPAGFLSKEEAPLAAARRELLEETGYEASHWRSLGSFVVDGNRGCGRAHLFLARDARPVRRPVPDDEEQVMIQVMTYDELQAAWNRGEFAVLSHGLACSMALNVLGGKPS